MKIIYYFVLLMQARTDYKEKKVSVVLNYVLVLISIIYAIRNGFSSKTYIVYSIIVIMLFAFKGIASGDLKVLLSYGIIYCTNGINFLIVHMILSFVLVIIINAKSILRKEKIFAMIPEILIAAIIMEVINLYGIIL